MMGLPTVMDLDDDATCPTGADLSTEVRWQSVTAFNNTRVDNTDNEAVCQPYPAATSMEGLFFAEAAFGNVTAATNPLIAPFNVTTPDFRPVSAAAVSQGSSTVPPANGFFDVTANYRAAPPLVFGGDSVVRRLGPGCGPARRRPETDRNELLQDSNEGRPVRQVGPVARSHRMSGEDMTEMRAVLGRRGAPRPRHGELARSGRRATRAVTWSLLGALLLLLLGCQTPAPPPDGPPYIALVPVITARAGLTHVGTAYSYRITEISGTLNIDERRGQVAG